MHQSVGVPIFPSPKFVTFLPVSFFPVPLFSCAIFSYGVFSSAMFSEYRVDSKMVNETPALKPDKMLTLADYDLVKIHYLTR